MTLITLSKIKNAKIKIFKINELVPPTTIITSSSSYDNSISDPSNFIFDVTGWARDMNFFLKLLNENALTTGIAYEIFGTNEDVLPSQFTGAWVKITGNTVIPKSERTNIVFNLQITDKPFRFLAVRTRNHPIGAQGSTSFIDGSLQVQRHRQKHRVA